MPEQDHYGVLGLPRTATPAEIKRRYRQLMREAHPDANAGDPASTRQAARINLAYETLGDSERRSAYDERSTPAARRRRADGIYAHWAEQPDWEDIVAEHAPPRRPAHVHDLPPLIEPDAIDIDMDELRAATRVRRSIRVTNNCQCTLKGDVSTTEPWVWGPIGRITIAPGESAMFEIEVVARRVRFPGIARVQFVANEWTGTVPVRIQGYEKAARPRPPAATEMAYVRQRGRRNKWARSR